MFKNPMIATPPTFATSPGTAPSTLPPRSTARSTITDPSAIEATMSRLTSFGAGRPGMSAVVMMMSTSSACLAYNAAALAL